MIKTAEVRIGNLLHWEADHLCAGTSKVITIDEEWFEVESLAGCQTTKEEYSNIKPILLTSEWLERMGFKWNEEDWRYFIQVGNTLYIEFEKDFDCSITPETWRGSSITPWADIKHVHQLQNLYHSLTGEELKLKDQ